MMTIGDLLGWIDQQKRSAGRTLGEVADSVMPTPARLYWETVARGKRDPITSADFTPEELKAIRDLVSRGKRGAVTYGEYGDPSFGVGGMFSPEGRVANALGQFNYEKTPEGMTVRDKYDFNPVYSEQPLWKQALTPFSGPFAPLHLLGEYAVPPGNGRSVQIDFKD